MQLERSYAPKLLAVTGTNGKTTVTALTGQLLERSARRVAVAGNIGPTLLDTLREWLVQPALPEVWVLELSSFQLDACAAFEPSAVVVLNLSQDHLDWHENMAAYATAGVAGFGLGSALYRPGKTAQEVRAAADGFIAAWRACR